MTFWSTSGILYLFSVDINTRKTFFFKNKCLYKYFNSIIYCPIFFKYVLIYRRNSMCLFSHFKYQEKCLFRLNIFPMKNYLNWWNRGNTVIAFSLFLSYCVLFLLNTFLSTNGILCVFFSILNNRKHVSVV